MEPAPLSEAEILFERIAADLASGCPDLIGRVVCPLCLVVFDRAKLGQEHEQGLTVEHIIPRALGGTHKTLTCKRCNNTQGSELDAHLVRKVQARDWIAGGGKPMQGTITMGDLRLSMTVAWGGTEGIKNIRIRGGKPAILAEFPKRLRAVKEGDTFKLHFSLRYRESNARRALIRIGYLALFNLLGYSYVLSPAAAYVRDLIAGSNDEILERLMIMRLKVAEEPKEAPPLMYVPIQNRHGVNVAYLVSIRIDSPQQMRRAVLLPSESVPQEFVMRVLQDVGPQLVKERITMTVAVRG